MIKKITEQETIPNKGVIDAPEQKCMMLQLLLLITFTRKHGGDRRDGIREYKAMEREGETQKELESERQMDR